MMLALLRGGLHDALDLLGAIPVFGEPADLANAAYYALEGDGANAAFRAAAALPIVGWAATAVRQVAPNTSRILLWTERNLQKGFTKHGADFGLSGNWGKGKAAEYSRAIHQFINGDDVRVIAGTYRGQSVVHYLDAKRNLNVVADQAGYYLSAWKLSRLQKAGVILAGRLF